MTITRLYLARHGQVINHHIPTFNGHFDVDITEKGLKQMENLADFLKGHPIEAIYSSDLVRAYKGAELIAKELGVKNERLPDLKELNLGRWEGLTLEEVRERYPEEVEFRFQDLSHYRIKGGENLLDLSNRVVPTLEGLLKFHMGKAFFILAHGGVNRAILCHAMGLPIEHFFKIEQDYGCLNIIDYFYDSRSNGGDDFAVVKMINGGPNQEMTLSKIY